MIESLRLALLRRTPEKSKEELLASGINKIERAVEKDRWIFRYTDPGVSRRMLSLAEQALPLVKRIATTKTDDENFAIDSATHSRLFNLISFWLNKHTSADSEDMKPATSNEEELAKFADFAQTTGDYFEYMRTAELIPVEAGRLRPVEEYFYLNRSDCPAWLKKQLVEKYYQHEALNWRQMQAV